MFESNESDRQIGADRIAKYGPGIAMQTGRNIECHYRSVGRVQRRNSRRKIAIDRAIQTAAIAAKQGLLTTFGIIPSGPETGYGYIRRGGPLTDFDNTFAVAQFVEKPNLETAQRFVASGDALVFRGDVVHGGGENRSGERRRVLSISYCAGWLRPVENSFLNVSRETARRLPPEVAALLGYAANDESRNLGGMVGLFENGDPSRALRMPAAGS